MDFCSIWFLVGVLTTHIMICWKDKNRIYTKWTKGQAIYTCLLGGILAFIPIIAFVMITLIHICVTLYEKSGKFKTWCETDYISGE